MSNAPKPLKDLLDMPGLAQSDASSSKAVPKAWIERLFARLHAYYGNRFSQMWGDCNPDELKAQWAMALTTLRPDQIAQGLQACLAREWPPSLPEFIKLCRMDAGYEAAWLDAVKQMHLRESGQDIWREVACYWAAVRLGRDLLAMPYGQLQVRWRAALDEAREKAAAGLLPTTVPQRRPALMAPGQGVTPRAQAQVRLAEIRQRFGY